MCDGDLAAWMMDSRPSHRDGTMIPAGPRPGLVRAEMRVLEPFSLGLEIFGLRAGEAFAISLASKAKPGRAGGYGPSRAPAKSWNG